MKTKNNGHTNFYECCDLMKKSISNLYMYELKYQKSNIRITQIVHIIIQTMSALPCFFPEILKVSQFMNQINPLHCFQNGFGWLKTISRSISKNQRNPIR